MKKKTKKIKKKKINKARIILNPENIHSVLAQMKKAYASANSFDVILETTGKKYKASGETIDQALANLGLSWEQIKAKGVIKVSKGKDSYEHLFNPKQLRRIFANKLTRFLWAKRLGLLLNESVK